MVLLHRRQILKSTAAAAVAAVFLKGRGVLAQSDADGPKEHIVRIKKFKFAPDALSVRVGDRITWINDDLVPHTATATDEGWDSGTLEQGDAWTLTVTAEGTGDYFCRFHPMMKGKLTMIEEG